VKRVFSACGVLGLAIGTPVALAASREVASQPSRDLVRTISRDDCDTAVVLAKHDTNGSDAEALFLIGRMVEEGVCVQQNGPVATALFSRAADLGNRDAALEYATQVGLGEGVQQSYERAGALCSERHGAASQGLSSYSLGYVCTLRGVASRLLRESLPRGVFVRNTGATQLEFNPAREVMHIRVVPRVARGELTTGSVIAPQLINAREVIDKAWSQALSSVPKPDAARLADQVVAVTLDLDLTIEGFRRQLGARQVQEGLLVPGDIHATSRGLPGMVSSQ
jgi:hypothetical protein